MTNINDFDPITEDAEKRSGKDRRQEAPWNKEDKKVFGDRRSGFERRDFERNMDSEDDDPL